MGTAHAATRTTSGLQALYDFGTTNGPIVKGQSRSGAAPGLKISDTNAVRRSAGILVVRGETLIRTQKPAATIIESVRRSGETTIEAWIQPARLDQSGPARIITLSENSSERNFTLGQDGDRFDVRFRTTKTSGNGLPSLSTPPNSLTTELTHVVYTRGRNGKARLYLNGELSAEKTIKGNTSGYSGNMGYLIPWGKALANLDLWIQAAWQDSKSRALSLSQARHLTLPDGLPPAELPRYKTVYDYSSPTKATGFGPYMSGYNFPYTQYKTK